MARILCIDDKQDNLTTISAVLKKLIPNCDVISAQSGAEGLEKAKAESPDTILLDIEMPELESGNYILELIAAEKTTKSIVSAVKSFRVK